MEALQFRQLTKTPDLTSTIHVFETGTTDLVTGLTKMDGSPLTNPFTVADAGTAEDWGFKPANDGKSHIYDIYWNEEDVYIAAKYLFSPSIPQPMTPASSPTFAGLTVSAPGEIDGKISGQSFTGFESQSDTVITFDDATRTFSISPLGDSYNIWLRSVKVTKSAEETIVIPDVEGLVIVIFSDAGDLEALTAPQFAARNPLPCLIAAYYWDAVNKTTLGGAMEERHGVIMDSATHHYLHFTKGTQFRSGGNLTVNGDSSIAITNVTCYDEDLDLTATHADVPANPYEQDLDHSVNGYGLFPVIYLDGASGAWRKHAANQFPWHEENSNLVYNEWTGATWQQTELPASWHTAYFIVMTNMSIEPVKIVMGQFAAQRLADVQEASTWEQLVLENIISAELKVLYRVIVKNNNNPSIVEVQDLRSLQNVPAGTYTANDHNALTGRSALNSHPASAIGYTPSGGMTSDNAQDGILEAFASEGIPGIDGGVSNTLNVSERDGGDSLAAPALTVDGGDSTKDMPDYLTLAAFVGGLRRTGFNLDSTAWVGQKQTIMEMLRFLDQEVFTALATKYGSQETSAAISAHNVLSYAHTSYLAEKNGSATVPFAVETSYAGDDAVPKKDISDMLDELLNIAKPLEYTVLGSKTPNIVNIIWTGTRYMVVTDTAGLFFATDPTAINYATAPDVPAYLNGVVTEQQARYYARNITVIPDGTIVMSWKTGIYYSVDEGNTWVKSNFTTTSADITFVKMSGTALGVGCPAGDMALIENVNAANLASGTSWRRPVGVSTTSEITDFAWMTDSSSKKRYYFSSYAGELFINTYFSGDVTQNWTMYDPANTGVRTRLLRINGVIRMYTTVGQDVVEYQNSTGSFTGFYTHTGTNLNCNVLSSVSAEILVIGSLVILAGNNADQFYTIYGDSKIYDRYLEGTSNYRITAMAAKDETEVFFVSRLGSNEMVKITNNI